MPKTPWQTPGLPPFVHWARPPFCIRKLWPPLVPIHTCNTQQGLATGPLKALAWMARTAGGLPALQSRLQLSVVRAFSVATSPSKRRESLPLPLSFVVWLERRVQDPATPPSEAVWASLRWGDMLWVPPDRVQLQLSHGAILGSAVRTKTTNRAMPFGFMIFGLSGTPSSNWGIKFHNLLRQSLADTLSHQPGRVIDFLPARLGGSDARPLLLDPCQRHHAVPRLLSLLSSHWAENSSSPPPEQFTLYGAHSCKATVLSWSRQMSLDRTLRRIQGHHRLSGADRSVELYGRDDIRPMLDLQAQVINHVRAGFRPLQPLARGSATPLPDFPVQLPSSPLPTLADPCEVPMPPADAFPPSPPPLAVLDPSPPPVVPPLPVEDSAPSPVDSPSSVSASSADSEHEQDSSPALASSSVPPSQPEHDARALPQPALASTAAGLYVYTIIVPMSYTLPAPPCPLTRRAFQIHNRQTNSTAPPAARVRIVTAWNPSAVLCPRPHLHVCTEHAVPLCLHSL